jgi:acyl-CoA synthetase (AMP-forming)/AMP-acid ligase II
MLSARVWWRLSGAAAGVGWHDSAPPADQLFQTTVLAVSKFCVCLFGANRRRLRPRGRQRLATYKIPRRVEFVGTLPKSATGKILKRVLRDEANRVAAPT